MAARLQAGMVHASAGAVDALAAICYSLAAALTTAAAKDDTKLREQYAASAVQLLRQAVTKGYKDIEHLKKDDDLKTLRERDDYKKLLIELEKS